MPNSYFLYKKVIYCEDTKEQCTGYKEYLNSKHWNNLRSTLITPNSKCSKCGEAGVLQLHHLTYIRLGHEQTDDFMILCPACHKKVHENLKSNSKTFKCKKSKKGKRKKNKSYKKVKKEPSAKKVIKKARKNRYLSSCIHCMSTKDGEFQWCDLNYKYCPFIKCGDYKEKEKENERINKCKN